MPHGQHVLMLIGFRNQETNEVIWDKTLIHEIHNFLADIIFREEHVGRKAVLSWIYVNTKGELSVWSNEMEVMVI